MMIRTEPFVPAKFISEGTVKLRGIQIPYKTVCEDNVFYDDEGKAIASIFSYSYFRSDVEDNKNRPILFGFNGGPGASSMMVHVGFLGTKRMIYSEDVDEPNTMPPFQAGDNPNCLLDIADIVLIDPVGTGFGVLLDETYKDTFFTSEGDAESLLLFIRQWLTRYKRWNSPKYLVGESYGCTRAAIAAGIASGRGMNRAYNMAFDGLILIGNTITIGDYFNKNVPVEPAVLQFPTCAAINWYYNNPSQSTLKDFVDGARNFADTKYLLALHQGDALTGKAREKVKKEIQYYTGVSDTYLEEHGLRLDESSFRIEFGREKKIMISRHDARITLQNVYPQTYKGDIGLLDDAVMAKYGPIFDGVLHNVLLPNLGINFERTFVDSYYNYWQWEGFDVKFGNSGEELCDAMRRCPQMRVFFANGWYDLCTQIGIIYYTINHAGLPKDRVYLKGYPSGHMLYIGEDNVNALTNDIRIFIQGNAPTE